MFCRYRALLPAITALSVLIGSNAWALHFTAGASDIERQVPPSQASEPGSGVPSISASAEGGPESATFSASVGLSDRLSVTCPDEMCSDSSEQSNLATFPVTLDPDAGDRIGDPVTLCITYRYSRRIETTGNFTASATAGGSPITDPASVVRAPGSTVLFSEGPSTITSGSDSKSFQATAHAAIGDTITISVGERATVMGSGIGGASVTEQSFLGFSSGTCVGNPAPAASFPALVGLALALGGLGVLAVRRATHRA
jgi:hypothetical protein